MNTLRLQPQACVLLLLVTALGAGCSSSPSNTQRGVAGGAALGALAGAVIGNNRGSGNAASGAAIGAAAGAIAGGAIGHNADKRQRNATTPTSQDPNATNIYVQGSPPLPPAAHAESVTARPTDEAVWIPGYWSYENGRDYAWVAGHWEIPPSGYRTFQPPEWRRQGDGYVYVRGHWR
ncbi:MAG TPA: YXWGXW repeat-containing protein [Opitutus sp.]|nr:YXWGXW repeat-containing protein [Opitutus sp.]